MKPTSKSAALLVAVSFAMTLGANAVLYWDGSTSIVDSQSNNTTTTGQNWLSGGNWDNGTTSAPVAAWAPGEAAVFGGSAASQTITAGTLTAGNLTFGQGGAGAGTSGTAYTISGGTITLASSTITTNTATVINSVLSGSTGLIKTGAAQLTLGGTNNYTGGTILSSGTIQTTSDAALSSGSITLNDANTGSSNTTLTTNANTGGSAANNTVIVANQGTGTTTLELTLQNSQFGGASIQLNKATTVQANYNGIGGAYLGKFDNTSVVSGNVGTLTLRSLGTGKLYVSGNNTFVGTVNITGTGIVSAIHANAFGGSGNSVVMSDSAVLDTDVFDQDLVIGDLTGTATNSINRGTGALTISSANSAVFAGVINGSGALTKSGNGTQTLSGANTYSGTTNVNGGALLANNTTGSATGTGAISVLTTSTIGGTGRIAPEAANGINVANGGHLAPGSPGLGNRESLEIALGGTTATVGLTMATGSDFRFELGAANASIATIIVNSSDLLIINGAIAGDVSFNSNNVDFLGTGQVGFYKLFDSDLAAATMAADTWGGLVYDVTTGVVTSGLNVTNLTGSLTGAFIMGGLSSGGDAGDIYLSVVPEPSAALLGSLGLLALLRRRHLSSHHIPNGTGGRDRRTSVPVRPV